MHLQPAVFVIAPGESLHSLILPNAARIVMTAHGQWHFQGGSLPFSLTTAGGLWSPVGPENPNRLKYLTSAPVVIMLERWDFPYLFTVRERISDHATHRRNPHHLHLDLVLVDPKIT